MSILSTLTAVFSRMSKEERERQARRRELVNKYQSDVTFFRAEAAKIEAELDPKKKAALLRNVLIRMRDKDCDTVAKMAASEINHQTGQWTYMIDSRARSMQRALEGDDAAREEGASAMQAAVAYVPILIQRLEKQAEQWEKAEGVKARAAPEWAGYQAARRDCESAAATWEAIPQQSAGNQQTLRAKLLRLAQAQTVKVVRLEILDPQNPLVAQWKDLMRRFLDGEDLSREIANQNLAIERALPRKIAQMSEQAFGVAMSA